MINGNVIPAQKVTGSIKLKAIKWLAKENILYPSTVLAKARIKNCITANNSLYKTMVLTAKIAINICTNASSVMGLFILSIMVLINKLPRASPKIKALSISSKACVDDPKTKLSILIQPISYIKDAAPVISEQINR